MEKILIAEDDRIHLKRITTVLGKHNDRFHVLPVENGREAIDVLAKEAVALLVTDIQMPEIDGLALLAHVSRHHPTLPCFVMTAYGTPELRAKMPQDLLRFYQKPFDIDALAADIIAALDGDIAKSGRPGISVISFLMMIQLERTTCIFEVQAPGMAPGALTFDRGVLLEATCGDLTGEAAAMALIPLRTASFRVRFFPEKPVTRNVEIDLGDLIDQALEKVG